MALLKELSLDAITDVVIVTGHARADSAASHALISPAKVIFGAFVSATNGELDLPMVLRALRISLTSGGRLRCLVVLELLDLSLF